mmetsp:Transcript_10915/g.40701  ORF Transcript_10915/g.40701 Transcript_10915/m.40701 type:complete len:345 (+) Transcript_10915:141-1175(+)
MLDNEEDYGEDGIQDTPLDYNETNEEGFSKIEYQIYQSLIEAKTKNQKANAALGPDEDPEPFDMEGWLETFTEANPKIDPNRTKYVSVYGIYSGDRDQLQVRQGQGKYLAANGDTYSGEYAEGQRNGHGFYEYKSLGANPVDELVQSLRAQSDTLKDLVADDKFEEAAKCACNLLQNNQDTPAAQTALESFKRVFYVLQSGTPFPYYDGEFKDNLNDGQGIMKYLNGNVYKGEWQQGQKQGFGVMYYANGDVYRGEWQQGKKHGSGSYFFSKFNSTYEGEWNNGKFVEGVWKMPDGIYYQGKFDDIPVDVNGQFVFGEGTRMSGEFRDSKFRPSNRFTVESRDQ